MGPATVVMLHPPRQQAGSVFRRVVGAAVGPLAQGGLNEPFGLAVGTWCVRPRAPVAEMEPTTGGPEAARDVARAIVGQDATDADVMGPEPCHRSAQEAGHRRATLVPQQLEVADAGVVVDRDVEEFPAAALRLEAPLARDAMPEPAHAAELFRIKVQQIAGAGVFITLHEQWRGESAPAGQAAPPQDPGGGGGAKAH